MLAKSLHALSGALLLVLAAGTARAADLNPAALVYKSPDQLKWRDPTGAAGINQAVLIGDPEKPGLYVVMNRFKPGNFSRPHFHPNDRFITVIKGTWWVATGNKFDPGLTVPTIDPHVRLDYMFVPIAFRDRVVACEVVRHPDAVAASDHFPVMADFAG